MRKTIDRAAVAAALHARLEAIDLATVPVITLDRSMPRMQQAAETRRLFKLLAIKGVSVTTPNYSMAQGIDIRMPKREDHNLQTWPHQHGDCCKAPAHDPATRCAACRANSEAEGKLLQIMAAAFPQHDNRSDSQSDYFDYCYTIN